MRHGDVYDHSKSKDGGDGIRTLRFALKLLLRRLGLRALKIEQTSDD